MRRLSDRLAAGETILSGWSGIPDALTVEAIACTEFDAVTLDMQHGGHHEDSVLRSIVPLMLRERHAIVRIPVGRFDMASRSLDFGAEAVIAPMINSVEDARRFAAAMNYPPRGERSWGPTFALPRSREAGGQHWLESSRGRTLAFAMIETRAALAVVDEIAGTEGIDGIFVGPSDFSIAWTEGRTIDPSLAGMMDAIAHIAERTKAAGKLLAVYSVDPGLVGRYHAMGYRLFALGSDYGYIQNGAAGMIAKARESIA
ncbi:aldolase/citrate lyase family protein [Chelativorans sp. AA-79]|uniref:HpcH/HpaI aldolase family protein n=1 Tax=Chelativorans sp. AA-79 TaxID=3028735 RepID=UPI0023F6F760|nr:aldolase/citrate lyase family protein [Chelativorans sp. AA-79]WEX11655.1 aldolase/citrate lyase family protein [Chelativorans sp. AA-79]